MCAECPAIATKSINQRILYMLLYGQGDDACPLARERLAWLQLQGMLQKRYARPMPDDPEPHFWPSADRKPASNGTLSLIERIKHAYRIEDIAARHTKLRGTHTLTGPCFLHAGSGSEFVIWVDEQRWKCWGRCGTGGDVVDLVRAMKERGISWNTGNFGT